jgi:hypothetical protein
MGDRVLFQAVCKGRETYSPKTGKLVKSKKVEFGPVIYGHWSGDRAPAVCQRIVERMASRPMDVEYTSARLVQEVVGDDTGNLSVGLWNAKKVLTAEDSHGDAGVVLVKLEKDGIKFECFGGYLEVTPSGFVRIKDD